ncbi:MAG: hypothetical protein RIS09_605, partial [Actinomycetota bacterium]
PLELGFCHWVLQDLLVVYSPGAVNLGFVSFGGMGVFTPARHSPRDFAIISVATFVGTCA